MMDYVKSFLDFQELDLSKYEFLIKIGAFVLFCFLLLIIIDKTVAIQKRLRKRRLKRDIRKLTSHVSEMTPQTFFHMRNSSSGGRGRRHISSNYEFPGIYILFNHTKNMYYVGQGKRLLQRVNNHFTGHGNGDVYADYKYGDEFTIKLIPLAGSGFHTLNELERYTIRAYGAYSYGYNRTRGNRG